MKNIFKRLLNFIGGLFLLFIAMMFSIEMGYQEQFAHIATMGLYLFSLFAIFSLLKRAVAK